MNECLQGIRAVKFYAWEAPLASRVNELRASELAKVLNYLSYKTLNSFAVIVAYTNKVKKSSSFTPAKAYLILSILNVVRMPMLIIPGAATAYYEMCSSYERLTKFLLLEEIEELPISNG
eukprot:gene6575-8407_t